MNGMIKEHNVGLSNSQLFTGNENELDKLHCSKEDFYSMYGDSALGWEVAAKFFFMELMNRFEGLYCFLSLNYWQPDSRVVRHNGLGRFLVKNYELGLLKFDFEGDGVVDGRVNFWGVIKLTSDNYDQLFSLVDRLQTGVIFNESTNHMEIPKLADRLFKDLDFCEKSYTSSLNKVCAIRDLLGDNRSCIFTYSNEELGDYHMSIFYS